MRKITLKKGVDRFFLYKIYNFACNAIIFKHKVNRTYALVFTEFQVSNIKSNNFRVIEKFCRCLMKWTLSADVVFRTIISL